FSAPTPAQLAQLAGAPQPDRSTAAASPTAGPVGPLVLPPIAHWLATWSGPGIPAFTQARLVTTPAGLTADQLTRALQAVFDTHAGLRQTVTVRAPGVWTAEIGPVGTLRAPDCLRVVTDDTDDPTELLLDQAPLARARLDPTRGRTVQAVFVDRGRRSGRLLLIAHHLVIDEVSWQILLPDLARAVEQLKAGDAPRLDPVPTPLRAWTDRLATTAYHPDTVATLDRWIDARSALPGLQLDPGRDVTARARHRVVRLTAEQTAPLLDAVPQAVNAGVNDVLLTALVLGHCAATDRSPLTIDLEGHGREEPDSDWDLSRTVGWLTSLCPVRLDPGDIQLGNALAGGTDAGRSLKHVKEQLRAAGRQALAAGQLRYLNAATAAQLAGPPPTVLWNYLGRPAAVIGGDWTMAAEAGALGAADADDLPLTHPIEVTAELRAGPSGPELEAAWTWSPAVADDLVDDWVESWIEALDGLVLWARDGDEAGATPSDFDLVTLDQTQISMLEQMWKDRQ
ncbi:MAG: condensation domain-containing protein, partial [Microlunatus sp.]